MRKIILWRENKTKIAVVCTNGRVGAPAVKEAVKRGLDMPAVVRGENKTAAGKALQVVRA